MSDLLNALLAKHAAYQATLDAKRAKDEAEEALAEDRRAAKLAAREERKLHPKAKEPKAKKASKLPAILFKIEPALSALAFLDSILNAGKRPFTHPETGATTMRVDPTLVKSDETSAIAAFGGYDRGEPHGSQLDNARRRAQGELRPGNGDVLSARRGAPSAAGYVAGIPDHDARHRANVAAREVAAAETLIDAAKEVQIGEAQLASAIDQIRAASNEPAPPPPHDARVTVCDGAGIFAAAFRKLTVEQRRDALAGLTGYDPLRNLAHPTFGSEVVEIAPDVSSVTKE
jgi:hypothetical protein